MWRNADPEEEFYINLGIDGETAKKLSGGPGGIWYNLKVIFYGCLPFVFIALFVIDVIDLKSLLLLSLIWFVGNHICELLFRIFMTIKMSSMGICKSIEITNKKIDVIIETFRSRDD